jgi:hypothetical protein
MAREESDREDLLREATALVERIELAPVNAGDGQHVVAGFRTGGAASFYFGGDTVYQFNANGQLRRAHCDGLLFKASRGKLVSLARKRLENATQLLSRELTDAEQRDFLATMCKRLRSLADVLQTGQLTIVGQVPASADVLGRIRTWLAANDLQSIANSPGAEE